MKKTAIIIALAVCAGVSANAQSIYDALRYSQNEYYGTARSIGMGNAMTALGGDLGSVGINPAGSAVNSFGQFAITPNVTLATVQGQYFSDDTSVKTKENRTRFTMPNFGFVMNYKTGSTSGVKNISFGIVGNATANYLDRMLGKGLNASNSYLGAMAANAKGYDYGDLDNSSAYNDYPWQAVVGYQSGLISPYGGYTNHYIGATEIIDDDENIYVPGALQQKYSRSANGNKYDILLNFGANVSDRFYFGANLGLVSLVYNSNSYMSEAAIDPSLFKVEYDDGSVDYFNDMTYREHYEASGAGVYAKVGFIAIPVNGLRIGAAIQTPTATTITEHWQYQGNLDMQDESFSATSPEGDFQYNLISPYRVNFGVAYTFGGFGLISADYEMTDFSTMKFRNYADWDDEGWDEENDAIKDYMGVTHAFRLGAEIKPVPEIALRAGYNLETSPERYYDGYTKKTPTSTKNAFSLGMGYSGGGSFFADFAFRSTFRPAEYVYPYSSYLDDSEVPEIIVKTRLFDVVATIGWRF